MCHIKILHSKSNPRMFGPRTSVLFLRYKVSHTSLFLVLCLIKYGSENQLVLSLVIETIQQRCSTARFHVTVGLYVDTYYHVPMAQYIHLMLQFHLVLIRTHLAPNRVQITPMQSIPTQSSYLRKVQFFLHRLCSRVIA